ncbi:sugar ABC transporter substrate-binding protein [Neobacillus sp. KR4-4]|uniref:sugar ABC transporter substrate-binding protein n=1 Tax=Neobacillus sp. KR4-4 TaxID=3344872 RepID=UPI0035C99F15
MKKLTAALIILTVIVLSLAGCGNKDNTVQTSTSSKTSDNGKKKVYVVLKSLDSEYFKFIEAGANAAFKDFNVDGTVIAPNDQTKYMEQINMLEDLLNQNPAGLVLTPSQPKTVIPILKQFKEKNIPVALLDSNVDSEDKITFIGNDDVNAGRKAGEILASKIKSGDEVAILEGISGTPTSADRVKGAKEALEKAGLKVVASQAADWDRVKATSVMEDILQAHPGIKGVIGANDEMALGALKASKTAGKKIVSVGMDGITEAVDSISQGNLSATVAVKTYDMGYKGVESIVKSLSGEKVEKKIVTDLDIVTKENANEKLEVLNKLLGK